MTTSMIRTNLELGLELGSLKGLIKATTENVMLLLDASGSMTSTLRNGKTRIAGLEDVVTKMRRELTVPMIAFGAAGQEPAIRFVDRVPAPGGGTPLHLAIPYAKTYGATRLVVISDGEPDMYEQSLLEARDFGGKIDVVFVGDPGDHGITFMHELAAATGGTWQVGDLTSTQELTSTVIGLLEGEVEVKTVLQGPGFSAAAADPDDDDDEADDDEADDDEADDDEADDDEADDDDEA